MRIVATLAWPRSGGGGGGGGGGDGDCACVNALSWCATRRVLLAGDGCGNVAVWSGDVLRHAAERATVRAARPPAANTHAPTNINAHALRPTRS
eukprot:1490723-Pleurochrysis_carterae.AAC.1